MSFFENLKIALESIRSNTMRSLLTMLGIIIGIASVIMIVSVGNGATGEVVAMFEQLGANTIELGTTSEAMETDAITFEDLAAIKEKLPSVKYASPLLGNRGTVSTENGEATAVVTAGSADLQYVYTQEFVTGRFFLENEYDTSRPVIVLSENGAKKLFGTADCLGQTVSLSVGGHRMKVTIIGVTEETNTGASDMAAMMGMDGANTPATLFLPATTYLELMGETSTLDSVYLVAASQEEMDDAADSAVALLEARHGNQGRNAYKAQNFLNALSAFETMMNLLTTFVAAVAGISLLVGGIGVMNIMLVSVTERTREIGIRKALGARTGTILFQFLTESAIITLIGGAIGLALGIAGAYLIGHYVSVTPNVTLPIVLIALVFSASVGMFFGIYPARKAARMRPIEALRRD